MSAPLGRTFSVRILIVVALLAAQSAVAVWQHFRGTRYFAWAPNDYLVSYDIRASVAGRALSPQEISKRYRLDLTEFLSGKLNSELGLAPGERYIWEDPPRHLFDRVEWYETSYGADDPARVQVTYQLDAGRLRSWRWPK